MAQEDVNYGGILEALNNKIDLDNGNSQKPYVEQIYKNGTSGYIIFSRGPYNNKFAIQWGRFQSNDATQTTVTFLKPFSDANYIPIVGQMYGTSGDATYWNWAVNEINPNYMKVWNATNGTNTCCWIAMGYIAN